MYMDVEDIKENTMFESTKEGDVRGKMIEE
jgi:hypothetical protein